MPQIPLKGECNLTGKEFQFETFWQRSLLNSMILMSHSEAFVQSTSLPCYETLFLQDPLKSELDPWKQGHAGALDQWRVPERHLNSLQCFEPQTLNPTQP